MTSSMQQFLTLGGSAAAILLLGIALLYVGLRGRRRGEGRFCRKCGYDLTGSAGERCSECGRDLKRPRAIVIGRRVRVHSLIIAGAVLLLVAAATGWPAYQAGKKVRWYAYAPEFLLLRDLRDPAPGSSRRAFFVLRDRCATGKLSRKTADAWVEFCVGQFENPAVDGVIAAQLDAMMTGFFDDGRLTDAQRARFFSAFSQCDFAVRPRVQHGGWCPVRLNYRSRWGRKFGGEASVELFVNGEKHPLPLLETSDVVKSRVVNSHSEHIRDLPLGEHSIVAHWRITIRDDQAPADAPALFELDRRLEGRTTVLDQLPPADTAFRHSADWDAALQSAIDTLLLTLDTSEPGRPVLRGIMTVRDASALPCNLAMRVLAQSGNEWVTLDTLWVDRGSNVRNGGFSIGNPPPIDEPATIIMVPDLAATANAIELGNFWDGQITFRDVPIGRTVLPKPDAKIRPSAEVGRVRER